MDERDTKNPPQTEHPIDPAPGGNQPPEGDVPARKRGDARRRKAEKTLYRKGVETGQQKQKTTPKVPDEIQNLNWRELRLDEEVAGPRRPEDLLLGQTGAFAAIGPGPQQDVFAPPPKGKKAPAKADAGAPVAVDGSPDDTGQAEKPEEPPGARAGSPAGGEEEMETTPRAYQTPGATPAEEAGPTAPEVEAKQPPAAKAAGESHSAAGPEGPPQENAGEDGQAKPAKKIDATRQTLSKEAQAAEEEAPVPGKTAEDITAAAQSVPTEKPTEDAKAPAAAAAAAAEGADAAPQKADAPVALLPQQAQTTEDANAAARRAPAKPDAAARAEERAKRAARSRLRRGVGLALLFSSMLLTVSALFLTAWRLTGGMPNALFTSTRHKLVQEPPPEPLVGLTASQVYEMAAPSVVSLELYETGDVSPASGGSGIILSEDGLILTNAHVVFDVPLVRVVLNTGEGFTASLVAMDPKTDLAVLKIDAHDLVPAQFGDSDGLAIGHRVYVIGNAAGIFPGSSTQGIISGLARQVSLPAVTGETVLMSVLQTDAAINPGNSGGALVNAYGQVVGVCVAKLEEEHIDNIGFAIPINTAALIAQRLIDTGNIPAPAKLGASLLALNETIGPARGLPEQGLYIVEITPQSHLNELDVAAGDVILQVDGVNVATVAEITEIIGKKDPGDTIELTIWRRGTQQQHYIIVELYRPAG
ncbi:trypsin-like peptidase domain-containing protein [Ruminococcaceae bacterium OttesenSCG-928-O06]|nr:trypsin-like peptidase domain-containing protein [Ruminococcaceae bacterium OttesenSCG-928-O06]